MRRIAFALLAAVLWAAPAQAQDTVPAVLSPADAALYRDIFAAQDAGQLSRADALIRTVSDPVLIGYVQHQRYMGRYYTTSFAELSAWMAKYADHAGAERIYRLALRKKPAGARNPPPVSRAAWRGERFDHEAGVAIAMDTARGTRTLAQLRALSANGRAHAAETGAKRLRPARDLPQEDIDRLMAFAASAYLADKNDAEALRLAEAELARGSAAAASLHWTAGLSYYRMGNFAAAAPQFEAMSEYGAPRDIAAGAFWAARAAMRAGNPERVVASYQRAAEQPLTFYGMLAARILGREAGYMMDEPAFDDASLSLLMQNAAVRRAVALWQAGWREPIPADLGRAFGEIDPALDPDFAALARMLGAPTLELRAAETSAAREIFLTSLYPVPPYEPQGGYRLDQAVVLAVARQESRFDPEAVSRAGARGLMQIMPATAAFITSDPSLARGNRARLDDPNYSMRLGEDYLIDLLGRQNGNLLSLTAAYNGGPGNLSRWLAAQESNDDPLLFIENIPAAETRDYVKRVMMNIWMYRRRFGEPPQGLDETAGGEWPVYLPEEDMALAQ